MNLTPRVVVLKPSRILATILLIAHAVCGVLIVLLPLAIWLKGTSKNSPNCDYFESTHK